MELWDLIGLFLGLIGGILAIYFMLRALGFGDYLGGKHFKPWAVPREKLYNKLLGLNSDELPYEIKPDKEGRCDLVLEWKLADAKWYGFFSKNRFSKWYKVYMLLDDSKKTVRFLEETGSISWSVGSQGLVPVVGASYNRSFFRGRILFAKEYSSAYGIKEDFKPGKIYGYHFDRSKIIDKLRKTVEECGWEFVPVTSMRHVTRH